MAAKRSGFWSVGGGFVLGILLGILLQRSLHSEVVVPAPAACPPTAAVMPHRDARPLSAADSETLASQHMAAAASLSGARGQGREGWLQLLAAFDANPTDPDVVSNLCENYHRARFPELAEDALQRTLAALDSVDGDSGGAVATAGALAGWQAARQEVSSLMRQALAAVAALSKYRQRGREMAAAANTCAATGCAAGGQPVLPCPRITLPFSTAVARWDLLRDGGGTDFADVNSALYAASLRAYAQVQAAEAAAGRGRLSPTDLNHALFRWQMGVLEATGDYWEGFSELPQFTALLRTMQRAAETMLRAHGFDERTARRKASHDTIFWVSVHTLAQDAAGGPQVGSVHEAHNTDDSRIGGVYYVSVPKSSGRLELFDPRGKPPESAAMGGSAKVPPRPPFHRTVTVAPREGMLVLFPGWLVHQVLPSTKPHPEDSGRYRVSISMNLKGEWQDTSNLVIDNVTIADAACLPAVPVPVPA